MYLAFDDGPLPEATPFILEVLAKYDIKATVFMVGDNVRKYPEVFRQVVEAGHRIGNHTFNHIGGFKHTISSYSDNAEKANEYLHTNLFRLHPGWMRWDQYAWHGCNYRIVMWELVTRQYSNMKSAEGVVNTLKRYARHVLLINFHN